MIPDHVKYTRIPWAPGGRSREGADCVGIVDLFLKEEFGFAAGAPEKADYEKIQCELLRSEPPPLETLKRGDILLFSRTPGKLNHVAVFLGNGSQILHGTEGGSRIDNGPELLRRVGFKYVAAVRLESAGKVSETLAIPTLKDPITTVGKIIWIAIALVGTAVSIATRPKVGGVRDRLGRYGESGFPLQTLVSTEVPLPEVLGSVDVAGNAVYSTHIGRYEPGPAAKPSTARSRRCS